LTLENVEIEAGSGFTVRNTHGLRFENVKVNGKAVSTPADAVTGRDATKRGGKES